MVNTALPRGIKDILLTLTDQLTLLGVFQPVTITSQIIFKKLEAEDSEDVYYDKNGNMILFGTVIKLVVKNPKKKKGQN